MHVLTLLEHLLTHLTNLLSIVVIFGKRLLTEERTNEWTEPLLELLVAAKNWGYLTPLPWLSPD